MSDSEKPKSWKELKQSIKHKWAVPFVYFEWKCEQLSGLLKRWAFLDILGHASRLAILLALISYINGCPERRMQAENQRQQAVDQRKAKHYQAWQVIIAAQGQLNGGGRADALQDLNRDGISLKSIDISKAFLPDLNLENAILNDANLAGADLEKAILTGADLEKANLAGAKLFGANLDGADIRDANFAGASLRRAEFAKAKLWHANFDGADLEKANFAGANLNDANLTRANLVGASLDGAFLFSAILTGADLSHAKLVNIKGWQEIKSIEDANIYGVRNPPDGFIEWAIEHGAVRIKGEKEWEKLEREKRQEQTQQKQ